jgi:hypothetical protein
MLEEVKDEDDLLEKLKMRHYELLQIGKSRQDWEPKKYGLSVIVHIYMLVIESSADASERVGLAVLKGDEDDWEALWQRATRRTMRLV